MKIVLPLFVAAVITTALSVYLTNDDLSREVRLGVTLIPVIIGLVILSVGFTIRAADKKDGEWNP